MLYVASAQDASKDQTLDEILVGPVPVGVNKFVLQADAPDPSQLAQEDLVGVTVVLVTCSYKEREFIRVGYYVNNEYHDPNAPPLAASSAPSALASAAAPPPAQSSSSTPNTATEENNQMMDDNDDDMEKPPTVPLPNPIPVEHIQRQILADKPRVTKFPIPWGDEDTQQQQQEQQTTQQSFDLVSMQEESNASFSGAAATTTTAAAATNGGMQAMVE